MVLRHAKTAFYRHQNSYVALLKIEGKTVRKVARAEVSGLAEGIATAATALVTENTGKKLTQTLAG